MLLRDGRGAQGDSEGEEARADEENDGEVEVVYPAEDRRARRGSHTVARAKEELGYEPSQAHQQAPN